MKGATAIFILSALVLASLTAMGCEPKRLQDITHINQSRDTLTYSPQASDTTAFCAIFPEHCNYRVAIQLRKGGATFYGGWGNRAQADSLLLRAQKPTHHVKVDMQGNISEDTAEWCFSCTIENQVKTESNLDTYMRHHWTGYP